MQLEFYNGGDARTSIAPFVSEQSELRNVDYAPEGIAPIIILQSLPKFHSNLAMK